VDIETTGLSVPPSEITTIALYDGKSVRHYVNGYNLDDFPRIRAMRAEFFASHGEICTERPRLLTEYMKQHGFETDAEGRPVDPELRQAGALHHILVNKEPVIHHLALLPGTTTSKYPGVVIYPEPAAW
jgi:hypothetical protein